MGSDPFFDNSSCCDRQFGLTLLDSCESLNSETDKETDVGRRAMKEAVAMEGTAGGGYR